MKGSGPRAGRRCRIGATLGFSGLDELLVEVGVGAAFGEELVVGAAFDDVAVVEHKDHVGVADGGEAMGDDEAGAAFE